MSLIWFLTLLALLIGQVSLYYSKKALDNFGTVTNLIEGATEYDSERESSLPFQASLQHLKSITEGYEHFCEGSIISSRFILTAGHCFVMNRHKNPNEIRIIVGPNLLNTINVNPKYIYHVATIIIHEQFKPLFGYDAALVRTKAPIILDGTFVTAISYNNAIAYPGTRTVFVKFDFKAETCRKDNFIIVPSSICIVKYTHLFFTDICARRISKTIVCDGDSGGALVDFHYKILIGILSYGKQNCQTNDMYVFTYINIIDQWIDKQRILFNDK